jgi:hypothetical protein
MVNRVLILLLVFAASSCNNSEKTLLKYNNDCNNVFSELLDSRETFLKTNLEDFTLNNNGKIQFNNSTEIDEYLLFEKELIKEANRISSVFQTKQKSKLKPFKLERSTINVLNEQADKITQIKNESTTLSLIKEFMVDFFLEVLFVLVCVLVISLFSMFTLKIELFRFIFGHWIIGLIVLILTLIIKPAERLGFISSSIDNEIKKSIEDENNSLKIYLDNIKDENTREIEINQN